MMEELGAIGETAGAAAVEMAVAALLERGGKVGPCTNCSAPMLGAYCGVCGQPVETHRRSVFTLLHDFVKDIASFDSRILRTARALLFQPGELSLAFREGRTQRYVPAVRLYLFVSLIFFLTLSFAGIAILQLVLVSSTQRYIQDKNHDVFVVNNGVREPMTGFKADDKGNVYLGNPASGHKVISGMKADGTLTQNVASQPHFFARVGSLKPGHVPAKILADMDLELKKGNSKVPGIASWINEHVTRMFKVLATDPAAINGPLTTWIPRALFILLPLFALILAAFYWRGHQKFFFVDHLVFSLNMHSFGFALLLIAAGLAQFLPGGVVAMFVGLAVAAYLLLAMKRFYRQSWFWTGAKFATVGFLYALVILPVALGGIIAYSLLNL
jgi:Protein of unknown function (DUF3667)